MRAYCEDGAGGTALQVVHSTPRPGISAVPVTAAVGAQVRATLARLAGRPSRRRLLPGTRAGQEDAGGDAQLPRYVLGDLRRRRMVGGG